MEAPMTGFREASLPVENLLLDPNNYRFHDDAGFVVADEARFHENSVQDRAFGRLRDNGLMQLKNSILKNGFLPVERIIVREYPPAAASFLIVEGNRRVAALRWIAEDHAAGVNISEQVLATIRAVPVLVVEAAESDPAFFEALMGVRHVSGIKQWGGYQRAKLVAVLRDQRGMESAEIGDRLAMNTQEVNRRYRAFKALEQMKADENHGLYARPNMYPMFHEAVSLPVVREWLGWDEGMTEFTNGETMDQFYRLIAPDESEDAEVIEPKIKTYEQVRDLRYILPNGEAKRVLLDPSRTFLDALTIAKREELSQSWKSQVATVISALESIGALDLRHMTKEDVAEIVKLRDSAAELLETYEKLTS
jgi:hypothetical protein